MVSGFQRNNHRIKIICFACVFAIIINCWTCAANFYILILIRTPCIYIEMVVYAKPTRSRLSVHTSHIASIKIRALKHTIYLAASSQTTNKMGFYTNECTAAHTPAAVHLLALIHMCVYFSQRGLTNSVQQNEYEVRRALSLSVSQTNQRFVHRHIPNEFQSE